MTSVHAVCAAAALALAALSSPASAGVAVTTAGDSFGLQVMSWRDIPFRTIVRQQYDYSCGSAALATLLRYHYGRTVGEAEIFKAMYDKGDQAKIRKVGFSLLDMKRYLETKGLAADGYRLTMAELMSGDRPAIAVVKIGPYRHFVVIKGLSGRRILVGDPALGLKTYDADAFQAIWDGVVFAIHDQAGTVAAFNQASDWRPWTRLQVGASLSDESLSRLTWASPSIYQVTPILQSIASAPLPGAP